MAFTWTAKKIDNGEVEQVKFTIKSDTKTEKIRGTISLNEDQTTTDPLVDWVKTKLGSSVVGQLETDAANVDDTPPPEPFT